MNETDDTTATRRGSECNYQLGLPPLPPRFDVVLRGTEQVPVWCEEDVRSAIEAARAASSEEIEQMRRTLTPQKSSYEREIAIEVAAERERIAAWLDQGWPADAAEERAHRAFLAAKLRQPKA